MMILTPVSAALVPCKICGEPAPLYGTVDFNRNCEIEGGTRLPPSGTLVRYRRCRACGFLFTDAFDRWSHDDFRTHISARTKTGGACSTMAAATMRSTRICGRPDFRWP
jgi:hypothetical protein